MCSACQPPGLAAGPVPVAARSDVQEVDEDSVDAYIRTSMHTAQIPGLALDVVHGDHVAYLKGYVGRTR